MTRYLVIVARDRHDLYDYLARQFLGDDEVAVLQDRRQGERRQRAERREPERRRSERREPRIGDSLRSLGVLVTRAREEVFSA